MELKKQIDNHLFIYKNVFNNESLLDKYIDESKKSLEQGDFSLNLQLKRTKFDDFSAHNDGGIQNHYENLSDLERFVFFNTKYFNSDYIEIDRKDVDIPLEDHYANQIVDKVKSIIETIYTDCVGKIHVEYSSVIHYDSHYKMNKHRDSDTGRICTAILYMNSKEGGTGGDVIFYDNEDENKEIYRYEPVKNDLVIFDSHFNPLTLPHEVSEIKDWERFVYRIYFSV